MLASSPIIGKILKSVNSRIKNFIKRTVQKEYSHTLNNLENKIESLEKNLKTLENSYKSNIFNLEDKIDIINQKIEDEYNIEEIKNLYNTLSIEKNYMIESLNKLDIFINKLDKKLESNSNFESQDINIIKENKFNLLYKEFEDTFRGTKEEIKSSLEVYLPFLNNISKKDTILDIGCGRGEWLELLQDFGFSPKGIDINETMVKECKKLNLDVKKVDAIEYLKNLPSNSLSVITGFHIIEHFDKFDTLLDLLYESYRVLKHDGIIIFETPNPRNILVSSSDFWLDPTHNKPIHPLTIKFFTKKIGYTNVQALIKDNNLIEIDEIIFDSLQKYVDIGREYALIGKKP